MATANDDRAAALTIWLALFLIGLGGFALAAAASMDDFGGGERSAWSGHAEIALGIFGALAIALGLILLVNAILTI